MPSFLTLNRSPHNRFGKQCILNPKSFTPKSIPKSSSSHQQQNQLIHSFGIYGEALESEVTSVLFFNKYFYCLWFVLKNLSSLGQNLATSTYVGEIMFAIIGAVVGLVLFALLIGNMQTYLQSTTVRLEDWRIRRMDTEQWMRHRQLLRVRTFLIECFLKSSEFLAFDSNAS